MSTTAIKPEALETPTESFRLLRQLSRFAGREAVLVFRRSMTPDLSEIRTRLSAEEVERLKADGAAGRYHSIVREYHTAAAALEGLNAELPERQADYVRAVENDQDSTEQRDATDELQQKIRNAAAALDVLYKAIPAARKAAEAEYQQYVSQTRNERLAFVSMELAEIEAEIERAFSELLDRYLMAKFRSSRYDQAPLPPINAFLAPLPERQVSQANPEELSPALRTGPGMGLSPRDRVQ